MIDLSYIAIPLFIVSGIPQTLKLIKRRSSEDVSLLMYVITWFAILFVLTSAEGGVFWSNMVSWIILTVNLLLILKFRL